MADNLKCGICEFGHGVEWIPIEDYADWKDTWDEDRAEYLAEKVRAWPYRLVPWGYANQCQRVEIALCRGCIQNLFHGFVDEKSHLLNYQYYLEASEGFTFGRAVKALYDCWTGDPKAPFSISDFDQREVDTDAVEEFLKVIFGGCSVHVGSAVYIGKGDPKT